MMMYVFRVNPLRSTGLDEGLNDDAAAAARSALSFLGSALAVLLDAEAEAELEWGTDAVVTGEDVAAPLGAVREKVAVADAASAIDDELAKFWYSSCAMRWMFSLSNSAHASFASVVCQARQ